ncbi:unnamed protein product, partial [Porites lobata]
GKGVFTTREFKSGDFLLEYRGEIVGRKEAEERENKYLPHHGSFMYFFQWEGKTYCNDATFSEGLGRLVNDERATKSNCHMKKIAHNNKVNLCLFAKKDIPANTELRYDYGVSDLPWRK